MNPRGGRRPALLLPVTHEPFCATPHLAQARALAQPFARLVAAVAADHAFLRETLSGAAEQDPHVAFLLHDALRHQSLHTPRLAILRSDYLHDGPTDRLLQVELNTVSCAFVSLATRVAALHGSHDETLDVVADALARAHRLLPPASSPPLVLMVVQEEEKNLSDQLLLCQTLRAAHGIDCVRRSLRTLRDTLADDPPPLLRVLDDDGQHREVSVVYYRACYDPADAAEDWMRDVRRRLARSSAVQCPAVDVQLVGCKKVQQALCAPGVVERFVGEEDAKALRAVFAEQWSAEALPDEVRGEALASPGGFVLKPQREGGGGHNLHGPALAHMLTQSPHLLSQYVLMRKMFPTPQADVTVEDADGTRTHARAVGEVGVYSVALWSPSTLSSSPLLWNRPAGCVVRVKDVDEPEGGVTCGAASLASHT